MEDSSKLPIKRVDYLNQNLTDIQSELELTNETINNVNTTLTARIDEVDSRLLPGDICYSFRTSKTGWLLCNGQAISRTTYKDLFNVIGTTYGGGDGSTTFNVPNCSGKFLQMDTSKTIGTSVVAGLPNITGTVGQSYNGTAVNGGWHNYNDCGGGGTGALYLKGKDKGSSCTWSTYGDAGLIAFDASRSNTIYGKSTTVQPPAIIVNYFIKY